MQIKLPTVVVWNGPTLIHIALMRIQCGRMQSALFRIKIRMSTGFIHITLLCPNVLVGLIFLYMLTETMHFIMRFVRLRVDGYYNLD